MFDESQIANKNDMPERNTFLDKSENIALCQISKKNICPMSFLLQKSIVIMI